MPRRLQLTLFIPEPEAGAIELIREKFNPAQQQLIASHVTLCREDEIVNIERLIDNLKSLTTSSIVVYFGPVTRFADGKGVLLPGYGDNEVFHQLRSKILAGLGMPVRRHKPHITLMHPRNSTCTDTIFEELAAIKLPTSIEFDNVSLIEQKDGRRWDLKEVFKLK